MIMLGLETGPSIVIFIRLLVPLTIFRFPLWGSLASIIMDALDVVLITILGMGDFNNYHSIDKLLDTYYLLFMAISSLKWEPLAKWTSIITFLYRTIGVVLFEITRIRPLMLIFPNLFENWFLFFAVRNRFFPKWKLTRKRLAIALAVLLAIKLPQEFLLHFIKAQPWNWMKANIFHLT